MWLSFQWETLPGAEDDDENNLKDTHLHQSAEKTIINAGKDGDGRTSFDKFCAVVGGLHIHKKMVVDV